jgi:hypothetical protein
MLNWRKLWLLVDKFTVKVSPLPALMLSMSIVELVLRVPREAESSISRSYANSFSDFLSLICSDVSFEIVLSFSHYLNLLFL